MKRNVSLDEISDGKLYQANDLVKADCGGCQGCSDCCHGMGKSIVLDPLDVVRLAEGTGQPAEMLLASGRLELNVVDGIILPNLKMDEEKEACTFLNESGRCSIHPFRPGICRLFPLGRFYHGQDGRGEKVTGKERSFRYFLQVHECPKPNKSKVKVRKWIDTQHLKQYEQYITDWHYFLEDVQEKLAGTEDETEIKNCSLYVLKWFYLKPYGGEERFYEEFYERLRAAAEVLDICGEGK